MKRRVIIAVTLLLAFNSVRSENYDQVLADLIQAKRWFEVDRYYNLYKDSLRSDFVKQLYKAEAGAVFNRFGESIEAYRQLIEKNYISWDKMGLLGVFGQAIINSCTRGNEYGKGIEASNLLSSIIISDTVADSQTKKMMLESVERVRANFELAQQRFPEMVVERAGNSNEETSLNKNDFNFIIVSSYGNGIRVKTLFDTGASPACFIWNKEVAKKLGVKIYDGDTSKFENGVRRISGLMDSLRLGNITIRNIPVYIRVDGVDKNDSRQTTCDSILTNTFDIVVGLPIMRKIGNISLDFKRKTISFPLQLSRNSSNIDKNIYMDSSGLLTLDMKVDQKPFLAIFDSGFNGGLTINSNFYTRNKDKIPIKKVNSMAFFAGGCFSSNIKIIDDNWAYDKMRISINNVELPFGEDNRIAVNEKDNENYSLSEGGFLGNSIFKYISKAFFDFNSMTFSIVL